MTSDRYTKAVLTVIAAALVWLCIVQTPIGSPVQAQTPSRVMIAGWVDAKNAEHRQAAPVSDFIGTLGIPVRPTQ